MLQPHACRAAAVGLAPAGIPVYGAAAQTRVESSPTVVIRLVEASGGREHTHHLGARIGLASSLRRSRTAASELARLGTISAAASVPGTIRVGCRSSEGAVDQAVGMAWSR
ncbi:hypothetical protein GCM10020367_59030 [Streptomyces sannanensis]|uniref:Uncharacterized protein n=1 Tax=Streptomyces sannanensis TaxID=285536 RepID=A0ABP6SKF9_9ACTN